MKILVCDPVADDAIALLKEAGHEVDIKTGMSPEVLEETIPPYHACIVRSATKVRKQHIDKATNLKVIARGGVGLDNIDCDYAKEKGIKVLNTPCASTISVAELTFAHMLAAARHIGRANVSMREGKWEKKKYKGVELFGKTLGLIGCGRIAREVAKRAVAFGMRCIAYDPFVCDPKGEQISCTDLDGVLKRSDFISLHTPLTDETRNIIDAAAIEKMKDGVILVNCGRGGTVDEEAVAKALSSGKIKAAGLDVYTKEPVEGTEGVFKCENTSFTPHIGASTVEGQGRVGTDVAQVVITALG